MVSGPAIISQATEAKGRIIRTLVLCIWPILLKRPAARPAPLLTALTLGYNGGIGREVRMSNVSELKEKIVRGCRFLYMDGLMDHSGHMSARIPGTDRALINPFSVSRAALVAEDVVTVDLEGHLVEGKHEPPAETAIHTCIYRARPDVLSIAHFHPHFATLFAIAGVPLIPVSSHGAVFGAALPLYMDPDHVTNDEQGQAVARSLGQSRAVLMRGHGVTVVGESVEACFTGCVYLEENARRQFFASLLGPPLAFDEDEIRRVAKSTWKEKSFKKLWDHYESRARAAGVI